MRKLEDPAARRAASRESGGEAGRCPVCGQPAAARYRPFCSARCADIDLGRWLKEGYRIPGEEKPRTDEPDAEEPR